MTERSVKSIIMGRKNWLFSQSYEGARSSAIIMSIIETVKRHDLKIEKYLNYLLDHLPNKEALADDLIKETRDLFTMGKRNSVKL